MIAFIRSLFARPDAAISEARPSDATAIARLHGLSFHRGWSEEEVETLLFDRNVLAHRALSASMLAGFIMSRRVVDEAEVLSVAVGSAFRGQGIAGQLLRFHLRRLAGVGTRTVFLEVDERNTGAVRLYARAGFQEVSRRPNYYVEPGGEFATALVLRRDLA